MNMEKKVLVLLEMRNGSLRNVSAEALTVARKLSEGGEVIAALFGPGAAKQLQEVSRYGANKLFAAESETLAAYQSDAYFQAFLGIVRQVEPEIILMGHTAMGRDLAPRVAARLGTGLLSDCTAAAIENGSIQFERPIYAGKIFQKRMFTQGIIMATLRPNNFETEEHPAATELIVFEPEIKDLRTVLKEIVQKSSEGVDLTEAKIIVSGGRGVKSAEGFKVLQELADVLGAAVGASRGACDAGYCHYSLQIGQTGKVVTPDLYIACGISGAIQHLAGMSHSKYIVAINTDPEAPIFQAADYGIVGDLFQVVPMLKEELQKVKQLQ
jgi:electron transfer flavoprotein alpha subunit